METNNVNIIGNYPIIPRVSTGILSLDLALRNKATLGLPLRTIVEIYGHPNVGKSSLSYYLAGVVCRSGVVPICDLEMLDREYLASAFQHSGFSGDIHIMDSTDDKGKVIPHENMLMKWAELLYSNELAGSAVLDSIGAIQPLAEAEGDFGEAFMGKRAKLVAQVSRALSSALRNKERPAAAFIVNHVHGIMGGRGHASAGGETLKYMAAVRMMLWTKKVWTVSDDDPTVLGFQVEGQIEKLRYGGRGKKFQFYIVPDYGVHQGVSALMDCIELGIAESKTTVKLDGKSLGYIKKDFLSYAADGKHRKFEPFIEAAQKYADAYVYDKVSEDD